MRLHLAGQAVALRGLVIGQRVLDIAAAVERPGFDRTRGRYRTRRPGNRAEC